MATLTQPRPSLSVRVLDMRARLRLAFNDFLWWSIVERRVKIQF
jgi:hypothetical protein